MRARGQHQPSPGRGRGRGVGMGRGGPATQTQSGRRPNVSIEVPQEFRRHILQAERQRLVTELKEEGCDIHVHVWNENVVRFDLFGTGSRLARMAEKVEQWISGSKKRTGESRTWVKVPAHHPTAWALEKELEERDERTARFKGHITKDEEPEYPETVCGPPHVTILFVRQS